MTQPPNDLVPISVEPMARCGGPQPLAPDGVVPRARWKMILRMALFVAGGALAGFLYYRFVGCRTGACPITSNPYVSTLYGALIGFLFAR